MPRHRLRLRNGRIMAMEENVTKINWYPGHMAKTKRQMEESIRLVDCVVEVVDARIPYSSKNPYLNQLWQRRPRVLVLNKSDLADPAVTALWKKYYEQQGMAVVLSDALHGKSRKDIIAAVISVCREKLERDRAKGLNRPVRMMVTGIPNTGKSTLINQLTGRADGAKTGNKPGVTKSQQWLKLAAEGAGKVTLEMLDTPGILWPKIEDPAVGEKIALIGSINEDILNEHALACRLLERLEERYPAALCERYKLVPEELSQAGDALMELIGRKRGHLRSGGAVDTERTARTLLDEFRGGKIGRITLETPDELLSSEIKGEADDAQD